MTLASKSTAIQAVSPGFTTLNLSGTGAKLYGTSMTIKYNRLMALITRCISSICDMQAGSA